MKELVCTFFGHRKDLPEQLHEEVEKAIMDLIQVYGVSKFYVGNEGKFDWLIAQVLQKLQKEFLHINTEVVLAYLPPKKDKNTRNTLATLYPEEVAKAPKRFAICRRNDWMLKQADFVLCYVKYVGGGARQFMEKAERQKKRVINLAEKI